MVKRVLIILAIIIPSSVMGPLFGLIIEGMPFSLLTNIFYSVVSVLLGRYFVKQDTIQAQTKARRTILFCVSSVICFVVTYVFVLAISLVLIILGLTTGSLFSDVII